MESNIIVKSMSHSSCPIALGDCFVTLPVTMNAAIHFAVVQMLFLYFCSQAAASTAKFPQATAYVYFSQENTWETASEPGSNININSDQILFHISPDEMFSPRDLKTSFHSSNAVCMKCSKIDSSSEPLYPDISVVRSTTEDTHRYTSSHAIDSVSVDLAVSIDREYFTHSIVQASQTLLLPELAVVQASQTLLLPELDETLMHTSSSALDPEDVAVSRSHEDLHPSVVSVTTIASKSYSPFLDVYPSYTMPSDAEVVPDAGSCAECSVSGAQGPDQQVHVLFQGIRGRTAKLLSATASSGSICASQNSQEFPPHSQTTSTDRVINESSPTDILKTGEENNDTGVLITRKQLSNATAEQTEPSSVSVFYLDMKKECEEISTNSLTFNMSGTLALFLMSFGKFRHSRRGGGCDGAVAEVEETIGNFHRPKKDGLTRFCLKRIKRCCSG
ncbi:hypothetical protein BaRGS_00013851 [Batillaria attramentaria]|uniref:Uncharacterized protein n=1 Tax=Batillaria attramentaria TaxID=370345 RepID=A0ABD0L691_9CAEN